MADNSAVDAKEALQEAENLIEGNQHEYAIFLLSYVITTNYQTPEALCKRAMCYMQMNRFKEASEDLGSAITLDRTIITAYVKQAKCYLVIGDLDNAIVALTSLNQVDSDSNFAKFELQKMKELKERDKKAKKLFTQEEYEEVIKIMDECLKMAEICIRFKLMKAECLIYVGRNDLATLIINDVLFTHKDDVEAVCVRAINLLYQEKYNLGLAELIEIVSKSHKAAELFRKYKSIIESRKRAEKALDRNNLDEAKKIYIHVLTMDDKNYIQNKNILVKLAEICFKQKIYADTIETCTKILDMENTNKKALKIRGDSNFELEDYDLALEDYNTLIKIENNANNKRKLDEIKRKQINDPYIILGVTKATSPTEMKKIYHKLAIIYHPDKNQGKSIYNQHKCKVKFAKINVAYNELKKIHHC